MVLQASDPNTYNGAIGVGSKHTYAHSYMHIGPGANGKLHRYSASWATAAQSLRRSCTVTTGFPLISNRGVVDESLTCTRSFTNIARLITFE